ncbi:MAG: AMP-binding protein [Burkholderiales bacterium]|nr:AMP-binding protein [Burkholderiales bacterium]
MTSPADTDPLRARRHVDPGLPDYPSVVHALVAAAQRAPERAALICGSRSISYAQYLRGCAGLARELIARGAAASRVLVLMGNGIDSAVAMLGVLAARAQMAPLNPGLTLRELLPLATDIGAAVLVCDAASAEKARAVASEAKIGHVLALGAGGLDPARWFDDARVSLPSPLPAAEDWATLPFTGGTTGAPKGAAHRHRNIAWFFRQMTTLWPVGFDDNVFLNVAPMFHVWGFKFATWIPVYTRSTLVIVPQYRPDDVLEAIQRHRVTVFAGGPPAIYIGMMASERFAGTDLSSLRYCLAGGAACPEQLIRAWEERSGCPLIEGCGMSEGAPIAGNPLEGRRKPLSVGLTPPDTEVEIVDLETGERVLAPGERGEVRVRGPQFIEQYRNRPEETAHAIRAGWLYTGDIGYLDEEGYLFLVDRKKELINVGGHKVFPREVDEVLHAHPAVREAAAVGVPDSFRGEAVKAFVALKPGTTLSAEALGEYCRANLVKYKVPTQIEFVAALPRTGANKIDKLKLRGLRSTP